MKQWAGLIPVDEESVDFVGSVSGEMFVSFFPIALKLISAAKISK